MRRETVSQTVLYLACKNGGKTPEEVLKNTWHSFSTGSCPANVCAWNPKTGKYNRKLYYYHAEYGNWNTTYKQLLQDAEGQCHAWTDLLLRAWAINGVTAEIKQLVAATNTFPTFPEFLVRNVRLTTYRPPSPATGVYRYYKSDFDLSVTGIPGQNMVTPSAKSFNCHFVVSPSLSTTYYDPSYGVKAESIEVYTPMAIGAWSIPYAGDLLWAPQEENPQRVLIEYGE